MTPSERLSAIAREQRLDVNHFKKVVEDDPTFEIFDNFLDALDKLDKLSIT